MFCTNPNSNCIALVLHENNSNYTKKKKRIGSLLLHTYNSVVLPKLLYTIAQHYRTVIVISTIIVYLLFDLIDSSAY